MITIIFNELTINDKDRLDSFFKLNYHENSHLNFTNLFMWRKAYNIMWCIEDDILYFKAKFHDSEFALQPLCKKERLFEAIDKLKAYFNDKNIEFTLSGLEENIVEELKNYHN